MLVVLANDLPPAVRGRMKLWFIEPRPNVFVSGVIDSVADAVVRYLHSHCPPESGVLLFKSKSKPPGYEISWIGPPRKPVIDVTGLQLIIENTKLPKSQDMGL